MQLIDIEARIRLVGQKDFRTYPDTITNDHPHQTQADIYLHIADNKGQGIDQCDLFRIHLGESRIKCEDRTEHSHGNRCHHNGPHIISQPHNEKGGQGGFRKAV